MKGLDDSSAIFQSSLRSVGSLSDEGLNNEGHSAKKAKVSIVANSSLACMYQQLGLKNVCNSCIMQLNLR